MSILDPFKQLLGTESVPEHPFGKAKPISITNIELSDDWKEVLNELNSTNQHIFITGRAGTGKSTLLQYFRAHTQKRVAVLAFTGVAAVNVQGQTIHSFFGFRPGITVDRIRAYEESECALYKNLDAIVIDEASMVRADLLDCVDKFLRLNGPHPKTPFGGIQMIFIGDLYQLEPVVPDEEKEIFSTVYKSPFFFDADVFKKTSFTTFVLKKIYRQQNDQNFIDILEKIRLSNIDEETLRDLNEQCLEAVDDEKHASYIYLVTTNAAAEHINSRKLGKLTTKLITLKGSVEGNFREKNLPTSIELGLKEGASVMLLNNDSENRWVNGDIATISKIEVSNGSARVFVKLESGRREEVLPNVWEEIRYFFNKETKQIDSEVIGTFTQFPLKLAWAVTIHKGQGKTFDRAIVDFGRGTFAHGHAYVALSRCTSLKGLILRVPLEERHIFINKRVSEFMQQIEKEPTFGQRGFI